MQKDNKYNQVVVDIKSILDIFKKRKWYFIGIFLVVLLFGLFFTFFIARNHQYKASTSLTLSTDNLEVQKILSKEYPQEAKNLWLIKEGEVYYNNHFYIITLELVSEELLNEVVDNLDMDLSSRRLNQLISMGKTQDNSFLIINTFYNNPEDTKKINKVLIDTYISKKEKGFQKVYNELVDEIEKEIEVLEEDLSTLSSEAEEYAISFNKKLIKDLSSENNGNIELKAIGFLPPELENQIRSVTGKYNILRDVLDNLLNNKELYIGRIEISSEPSVYENFTYFRNTLLSIIAAVAIGIIFIYIIDFIVSIKTKR